ncbi:MAG: aminopeptidase [Planctomycetota bacterium]|nr:MAG: aminopeptidase [Planctomycetota bacterium]
MAESLTAPHEAAAAFIQDPSAALSREQLAELRRWFESDPAARLSQNAVTQVTVDDVALDRRIVNETASTFSTHLDDWTVTNQKRSGRCWMFAGLNLFRVGAMKQMNLKEFEFSQNYTLFWDKLERANYQLEALIETIDRPLDDRTVAFLLDRPLEDGGQWNMFANIIRKHGVVPKSAMPETESSSNTYRMNTMLITRFRQAARDLRAAHARGAGLDDLRAVKREALAALHRILSIHLGTPPEKIDWQWTDKDREFHRDGEMTPRAFAEKYVTLPIDEYVCLVHDPRPEHPPGRTYTVQYLGNVVGGEPVIYLNVEIETLKDVALRTLLDGEPVWMGCDVAKQMRKDLGLWDARLLDYERVYGVEINMNKAERLAYHDTLMTHAMLFTGVDVVDGRPRRWRVENSWGEDNGAKGFYVMNDSWFDEYMFEIAARKSYLSDELRAALETEPVVLPPWDPMGALARRP